MSSSLCAISTTDTPIARATAPSSTRPATSVSTVHRGLRRWHRASPSTNSKGSPTSPDGRLSASRPRLLVWASSSANSRITPRASGTSDAASSALGSHGGCASRLRHTATAPRFDPKRANYRLRVLVRHRSTSTFTKFRVTSQPDEQFEGQYRSLLHEFENLEREFGAAEPPRTRRPLTVRQQRAAEVGARRAR